MEKQTISKEAVRVVLRTYFGQYKKYPIATIISFLLPAIGTILVFFIPPLILAKIVDQFIAQGTISLTSTLHFVILFAGSWLLGEILWRVGTFFVVKIKSSSITDLHGKAFQTLTGREYSFYADNFVGSLSNKVGAYSVGFYTVTDILYSNLSVNLFTITFASIVLWQYSPVISIILVGCILVLVIVVLPAIRRRSKLVSERHEASSKMMGRLSDAITNMAAVKAFSREEYEYKVYEAQAADFALKTRIADDYHNLRIDTRISPLYVLTNTLGLIAAIVCAGKFNLAPGAILVVFSYYTHVTYVFWQINYVYRNFEQAITGAAEFTQLFLDPSKVQDVPDAKALVVKDGNIEFKNIRFDYNQSAADVFLKDLNLSISSGQKVGLVGPSGGGKTTITKLVLRFIDIQSGSITIDNQNIATVTQESLRKAIAYVPQDTLLFHRSLSENIAYGNPSATHEEIVEAAKLAHADEFISRLPNGYETLVGERGIKLSGGQRQRIAIARAMLKKSKILILDEATSALDSESEKHIQEGLLELMKDKTALVIAHRLSTIKHLDRIVVLDKGKVVQDGTHDELVAKKNGMYAKLWSHQSGGFIEE